MRSSRGFGIPRNSRRRSTRRSQYGGLAFKRNLPISFILNKEIVDQDTGEFISNVPSSNGGRAIQGGYKILSVDIGPHTATGGVQYRVWGDNKLATVLNSALDQPVDVFISDEL